MPPFKFKLEQVLRYRRQLEDQAKQALAEATVRLQEEQRKLESLHTALGHQQETLAQAGGLHVNEVWLIQNYVKMLLSDIEICTARQIELQELVTRCRADLVEKAKERELLDKLKEKQAHRHLQEEKRTEQRVFDETATLRSQPQSF